MTPSGAHVFQAESTPKPVATPTFDESHTVVGRTRVVSS